MSEKGNELPCKTEKARINPKDDKNVEMKPPHPLEPHPPELFWKAVFKYLVPEIAKLHEKEQKQKLTEATQNVAVKKEEKE